MRLFAGLPLPDVQRAALARSVAPLWASDWPVRWTTPEAWHVTLQFYGERPAHEVDTIARGLRLAASGAGALTLELGAPEAIPAPARARLLWAAVAPVPALELLQHRVMHAARAIGLDPEARPFRPHVTLGRVRPGARLPRRAAEALGRLPAPGAGLVDRVILYESRPGPSGARYEPLESVTLGGSS